MKKIPINVLAVLACVAAMSVSASVAFAAPPQKELTKHEYALLSSSVAKLKTVLAADEPRWNAAHAICKSLGASTALMKSERASCLGELALLKGLNDFGGEQTKCGTTLPQAYTCLVPIYATLSSGAKAMHSADVLTRKRALKRGFSGLCLSALSSTAKQLSKEGQLARSTARLSTDMQTIAQVAAGQLPSSDLNTSQIQADVKVFEADARSVFDARSSGKLSDCHHV